MNETGQYRPLIIIGAGRSGTNMLRDTLTALPEFGTWPSDEINYVWRHGNRDWPDDEIPASQVSQGVARFIRRSFDKAARRSGTEVLVEKTCANSLRVPFVDRAIPNSQYVLIVRDGRDVTASAMRRWTGSTSVGYLARKTRFVPVRDLPFYGARFARNHIHRLRDSEGRLEFWGPRFAGFEDYVQSHSLAETCAMQWKRSVELAQSALEDIPEDRVLQLEYENVVVDPVRHFRAIVDFSGISGVTDDAIEVAARNVRASSIGRWTSDLDAEQLAEVDTVAGELLSSYGYR